MYYTITRNNETETLAYGLPFTDGNGVLHPWQVIDAWTDEELEAIGVTKVIPEIVEPTPISLEELKTILKANIDAQAEIERGKYITPGSGQAMTYQAKAAEAMRFIETSGVGEYPLLTAEVGVSGDTLADVANLVAYMYNQWLVIGGLIERARLQAKAQIDTAETNEDAEAVTADWPSP